MGLTMKFIKVLKPATLTKRYQRFLADVETADGRAFTIHCPNTGAMTGCAEPGMRVWMSASDNPKRKYRYTWELAQSSAGHMICVNTQQANKIAGEALADGVIPQLEGLHELQAEQKYGYDNRRIDWLGLDKHAQKVFIEVKSVTLAEHNQGYFPDTVSQRATQHLRSLMDMVNDGHRAVVLYVVLHSAIEQVTAASQLDPNYAQMCIEAAKIGVEFYALGCHISPSEITATTTLPVIPVSSSAKS